MRPRVQFNLQLRSCQHTKHLLAVFRRSPKVIDAAEAGEGGIHRLTRLLVDDGELVRLAVVACSGRQNECGADCGREILRIVHIDGDEVQPWN